MGALCCRIAFVVIQQAGHNTTDWNNFKKKVSSNQILEPAAFEF